MNSCDPGVVGLGVLNNTDVFTLRPTSAAEKRQGPSRTEAGRHTFIVSATGIHFIMTNRLLERGLEQASDALASRSGDVVDTEKIAVCSTTTDHTSFLLVGNFRSGQDSLQSARFFRRNIGSGDGFFEKHRVVVASRCVERGHGLQRRHVEGREVAGYFNLGQDCRSHSLLLVHRLVVVVVVIDIFHFDHITVVKDRKGSHFGVGRSWTWCCQRKREEKKGCRDVLCKLKVQVRGVRKVKSSGFVVSITSNQIK